MDGHCMFLKNVYQGLASSDHQGLRVEMCPLWHVGHMLFWYGTLQLLLPVILQLAHEEAIHFCACLLIRQNYDENSAVVFWHV